MNKVQKFMLFLILTLMPLLYFLWSPMQEKAPVKTQTIQIAPIVIDSTVTPKTTHTNENSSLDILNTLKETTEKNKIVSQEEEQNQILMNLKKTITQQEVQETEEKISLPKETTIREKVVVKKILKEEEPTKSEVPKEPVPKEMITKTVVTKPKVIQPTPIKNKIIVTKKVTAPVQSIVKDEPQQQNQRLSREEEVAQYKQKHASGLEVVNVSETFEINEVHKQLPDAHYFEPLETTQKENPNAPLPFVKKLGVVAVSNKYESNFTVPEKVELAKEGVVTVSGASIETQEIRNLEFVDTLGVVNVSNDFETVRD